MKRKNFVLILFFCWLVAILMIAYKYRWKDKSSTIGTNVGVKVEIVNPTTGSVTTEQGSVVTEPAPSTVGVRRVQFTVRPRLGDGGSTNR